MSLSETLDDIDGVVPFAVGGVFEQWVDQKGAEFAEDPELHITGVGDIEMPLTQQTANRIRGVAHRAPFGKGRNTIVDLKTRKTWELDPDQVKIGNNEFSAAVTILAKRTALQLGVPENVKVGISFYKVLLYEPGDFFLPHRDTEKVPGMFATLTISLRSKKIGGSTIVQHAKLKRIFDESEGGGSDNYHYAMFFADCMHEVSRLEEGHRLVLVYNVYRKSEVGANLMPRKNLVCMDAQTIAAIETSLAADLVLDEGDGAWRLDRAYPILYLLEHSYTRQSSTFSQLKGMDRTKFEYLSMVSAALPFRMALARIKASVMYNGHASEGDLIDSEVEYTLVDYMEAGDLVEGWIKPLDESDLEAHVTDRLHRYEPTSSEYEEYRGNYGDTEDQEYRLHGLVLYPIPLDHMKEIPEHQVDDADDDPAGMAPAAPIAAPSSSSAKRQSQAHPAAAPAPKRSRLD